MALRRDGSPSKPVWQELVTEYMERLSMSESVKDEYDTIENSFHNMLFKLCAGGAEMDSFCISLCTYTHIYILITV